MQLLDVSDMIVESLRTHIPNPHNTGQFIYIDYPRLNVTFPRISVTQSTSSFEEIGIGEYTGNSRGKLCSITYDIDVWVKIDDRTIINNELYVGTKLRDKYSDLIVSTLLSQREVYKSTYDVLDVEILSFQTSPLDEELMMHRKTVMVKVTFYWEIDYNDSL